MNPSIRVYVYPLSRRDQSTPTASEMLLLKPPSLLVQNLRRSAPAIQNVCCCHLSARISLGINLTTSNTTNKIFCRHDFVNGWRRKWKCRDFWAKVHRLLFDYRTVPPRRPSSRNVSGSTRRRARDDER